MLLLASYFTQRSKPAIPASEPVLTPDALVLTTALPLAQHPAAVYLAQLHRGSRRTIRQLLDAIARLLTQN